MHEAVDALRQAQIFLSDVVLVAGIWVEHFSVSWLFRAAQPVKGVNTTINFWLIAFIYVILGLLELDDVRQKKEIDIVPAGDHPRECSVKSLFGHAKLADRRRGGCTLLTGMVIWL